MGVSWWQGRMNRINLTPHLCLLLNLLHSPVEPPLTGQCTVLLLLSFGWRSLSSASFQWTGVFAGKSTEILCFYRPFFLFGYVAQPQPGGFPDFQDFVEVSSTPANFQKWEEVNLEPISLFKWAWLRGFQEGSSLCYIVRAWSLERESSEGGRGSHSPCSVHPICFISPSLPLLSSLNVTWCVQYVQRKSFLITKTNTFFFPSVSNVSTEAPYTAHVTVTQGQLGQTRLREVAKFMCFYFNACEWTLRMIRFLSICVLQYIFEYQGHWHHALI